MGIMKGVLILLKEGEEKFLAIGPRALWPWATIELESRLALLLKSGAAIAAGTNEEDIGDDAEFLWPEEIPVNDQCGLIVVDEFGNEFGPREAVKVTDVTWDGQTIEAVLSASMLALLEGLGILGFLPGNRSAAEVLGVEEIGEISQVKAVRL